VTPASHNKNLGALKCLYMNIETYLSHNYSL